MSAMYLERGSHPSIADADVGNVAAAINALRLPGSASWTILRRNDGAQLIVVGGPRAYWVERRDPDTSVHRAVPPAALTAPPPFWLDELEVDSRRVRPDEGCWLNRKAARGLAIQFARGAPLDVRVEWHAVSHERVADERARFERIARRGMPSFPFHPDPVETGVARPTHLACSCCGEDTGYRYRGPLYVVAPDEMPRVWRGGAQLDVLCLECIANGRAASDHGARFTHGAPVDPSLETQLTRTTPGFSTFNEVEWRTHCGQPSAYLGEASADDLRALDEAERATLFASSWLDENSFPAFLGDYAPGGRACLHRFRCGVCGFQTLVADFS